MITSSTTCVATLSTLRMGLNNTISQLSSFCFTKHFNWINLSTKSFSIVLLAVCGASYQFTVAYVGEASKQSDDGVIVNSKLLLQFAEAKKAP